MNTPAGWQYIYFGAAFLALVLTAAWPAVPRWGRPAAMMLAAVALTSNVLDLIQWSLIWAWFWSVTDPLCSRCFGT